MTPFLTMKSYQFPMGKVKLAGTKGVDISYANGYQFPMGKVKRRSHFTGGAGCVYQFPMGKVKT